MKKYANNGGYKEFKGPIKGIIFTSLKYFFRNFLLNSIIPKFIKIYLKLVNAK